MKKLKTFLLNFCLLFVAGSTVFGQTVYPVQVSGALIPPHSLVLSDYANERSQDLMFTVVLNDPVEDSWDVYFKVSIKHNGQEIMRSIPNFIPSLTTIFQFSPELITGSELAEYLDFNNMIRVDGGDPTNALPEGINQICLEVMDVERGIPISSQACVGGFFQKMEVPILNMPACGTELTESITQNLMFQWLPRHVGLPNAPSLVEYEFTLVELLPGIMDPNDGFNSAIQIYQTVVMTPTLLYTEGEPYLEPNKMYAWRVQVRDPMGSNVFLNDGFSQVCTFSYGVMSDLERTVSTACSTYETDYGQVPQGNFGSSIIGVGQNIGLGFFEMEITQLNGGGSGGFSGEGAIAIPFLNSKVLASFDGLKVNEVERVFEAEALGAVTTLSADGLPENMIIPIQSFRASDASNNKLITGRDLENDQPVDFPLLMDRVSDSGGSYPEVVVTNAQFSEREAQLTAFITHSNSNGSSAIFAGDNIPFTPYGIKSSSFLDLEKDYIEEKENASQLVILGKESNQNGSRVEISCEGFENYQLKGEYHFGNQIVKPIQGNTGKVIFEYETITDDFDNYLATVTPTPPIQLPNLQVYLIELNEGVFDYSSNENPPSVNSPDSPFSNADLDWEGFVFEDFKLGIPEFIDFVGNQRNLDLTEGILFLTEDGLYGEASTSNILALEQGNIQDWKVSIDELNITFSESELDAQKVKGKIKIPIIDEAFNYEGEMSGDQLEAADLKINTEEGYIAGMSLWNAQLNFDKEASQIELNQREINQQIEIVPFANLQGELELSFDADEFRQYLKEEDKDAKIEAIQKGLDLDVLPDLNLTQLNIKGLIADPLSSFDKKYRLDDYSTDNAKIKIGDKEYNVETAIIISAFSEEQIEELGLNLVVKQGQTLMSITIWAQKGEGGAYSLNRIEMEGKELNCDCI